MPLDTYDNLKQEIIAHLDRSDLNVQVNSFISLAEARHKREVRIREMIARATLDISARYASAPSGFLEMKTLRLLTSPVTVLSEVGIHEMNRVRKDETGKPKYFTVHGEIEFDRSPDSGYTAEMIYYQAVAPLSESVATNAVLTKAPDLYLYGALLAAAPFLFHDERIQVWTALYTSALTAINAMDRKRAGPLIARVVGATP